MKLFELYQQNSEDKATKIFGAIIKKTTEQRTNLIHVKDVDESLSEETIEELGRLHRADKIIYNPKSQTIGIVDINNGLSL